MANIKYHTGNTFGGNKKSDFNLIIPAQPALRPISVLLLHHKNQFLMDLKDRSWKKMFLVLSGWFFRGPHKCQDERWEFKWYLELPGVKYWGVSSVIASISNSIWDIRQSNINSFIAITLTNLHWRSLLQVFVTMLMILFLALTEAQEMPMLVCLSFN